MSETCPPVTVATLEAFSDAWNRHDIDALMLYCARLAAGEAGDSEPARAR